MKDKYTLMWTISLLVITCITLAWVICNFTGVKLPDAVTRIMGILDLCAIPILIYAAIKMRKNK